MKTYVKRLLFVSILYLISAGIGTALAVQDNLPAEFGGFLHGKDVLSDFILGTGTALSPPLIMLIVQILFMVFLTRNGALGRLGAGGLMVLAVLYTFGQLGEPILWRMFGPGGFHPLLALVIAANILLPVGMLFTGLRAWRRLIWRDSIGAY